MAPTLEQLGIDRLSIEDRLAVADAIWDSIAEAPGSPLLTESHQIELERRLANHELNPEAVVPWEQIKAEALSRFGK